MTTEPEKKPEGRPASGPDPGVSSTSILVFQRDESLAGLITRGADLSDHDFLLKNSHPVLLTAMPDEIGSTVWAVVLPVKRKEPRGAVEEALSKSARDIWQDASANPSRFVVGRAPECDIVLAPRTVSRRHATFELTDGEWRLMDLRSANGTRLAGQQLLPKLPTSLSSQEATKIEFGPDTTLWYVPPIRLLAYVRELQQQVPDTGRHEIGPTVVRPMPASTPTVGAPTISRIEKERLQKAEEEDAKKRRADQETNPLVRREQPPLLSAAATWHDGSTEEGMSLPVREAPRPVSESAAVRRPIPKSGEIEPRLLAAIRAIAALDSLILTVTARLKADAHTVTLYSAETTARLVDVPDQMVRMGPLFKTVHVSLSVGNGAPVEVYSDS